MTKKEVRIKKKVLSSILALIVEGSIEEWRDKDILDIRRDSPTLSSLECNYMVFYLKEYFSRDISIEEWFYKYGYDIGLIPI